LKSLGIGQIPGKGVKLGRKAQQDMTKKLQKKKAKMLAKLGRDAYGVAVPLTASSGPQPKNRQKIPIKRKPDRTVSSDWRNRPTDNRQVTHNLRRRMGR